MDMDDFESVLIKVEVDDDYEYPESKCNLGTKEDVKEFKQEPKEQLVRKRGRPKKNVTPYNEPVETKLEKQEEQDEKIQLRLRDRSKNYDWYDLEQREFEDKRERKMTKKKRMKKEVHKEVRENKTEEKSGEKANCSDSDGLSEAEDMPKRPKKMKSANHLCTICPMKFTRFMDLERHMFHHTGIRNYSCHECEAKFITTNDLSKHTQSHATEATFACPVCTDKKFRTVMGLRAHMKLCHTDKEANSKHLCIECGATFRTGSSLWMHRRRIHTDIRKFKCEVCEKGFCKQMELTNHMKSHSDYREFKCDLCSAEYKKKITLLIHKTEKHGIGHHTKLKCNGFKNQICPYCQERFALREQLQFHIRRNHTGAKPFQCCLCQKAFIRKGYVKEHLKRKHHMTGEQVMNGDYVISNEVLLNAAIPDDPQGGTTPFECSSMPMTPLVLPQAVYTNDSDVGEDYEDDDKKDILEELKLNGL